MWNGKTITNGTHKWRRMWTRPVELFATGSFPFSHRRLHQAMCNRKNHWRSEANVCRGRWAERQVLSAWDLAATPSTPSRDKPFCMRGFTSNSKIGHDNIYPSNFDICFILFSSPAVMGQETGYKLGNLLDKFKKTSLIKCNFQTNFVLIYLLLSIHLRHRPHQIPEVVEWYLERQFELQMSWKK